jgi:hypothetical protein
VWLLPWANGPAVFTQLADVPATAQVPIEEPSTKTSIEFNAVLSVAEAVTLTVWLEVGFWGECDAETVGGVVSGPLPLASFSVMVRSFDRKFDQEVV